MSAPVIVDTPDPDGGQADWPPSNRTGPTVYVGQQNTAAVAVFISKQRAVAERAKQEDVAYSLGVVEDALLAALRVDRQVVDAEQTGVWDDFLLPPGGQALGMKPAA